MMQYTNDVSKTLEKLLGIIIVLMMGSCDFGMIGVDASASPLNLRQIDGVSFRTHNSTSCSRPIVRKEW